jgi:hypothetical protein
MSIIQVQDVTAPGLRVTPRPVTSFGRPLAEGSGRLSHDRAPRTRPECPKWNVNAIPERQVGNTESRILMWRERVARWSMGV